MVRRLSFHVISVVFSCGIRHPHSSKVPHCPGDSVFSKRQDDSPLRGRGWGDTWGQCPSETTVGCNNGWAHPEPRISETLVAMSLILFIKIFLFYFMVEFSCRGFNL